MKRLLRAACSRVENLTLARERERGAKEARWGMILSGGRKGKARGGLIAHPARRGNPLFNLINEVASLREAGTVNNGRDILFRVNSMVESVARWRSRWARKRS